MLLDKMRKTIDEYHLLENGDKVICAVSGGADSICLLHTMLALKKEYSIEIFVANVNHLIRGDEAERDSDFVRAVCKAADVELFYREYDVPKQAILRKLGEEECGRVLRYEFFDELSKKLGNAKIATAHNLNDNAETVLFRLARGTSMQGLCGIMHKRDNIIRPLLDVTREEIEKYLKANSLSWCEDSTNEMPIYARNRIRLEVVPVLKSISKGAEEKIVSAAKMLSADNEFIKQCAKIIEKDCLFEDRLMLDSFKNAPQPLKTRIVAALLELWGAREINSDKIEAFMQFAEAENGKIFDINSHFYAQKEYDRIALVKRSQPEALDEILSENKAVCTESWELSFYVTEKKVKKSGNNIAIFDFNKLSLPLTVSYRKVGDRISLKGIGGTKKVNDIFTDEKISHILRDTIPIVRCRDTVIYISGIRQSAEFFVDKNTKRYAVIEYRRKEETKDE